MTRDLTILSYLPKRWLSHVGNYIAECQVSWIKNYIIRDFLTKYDVNLEEAERTRVEDYDSFQDFFTRALKPGARVFALGEQRVLSPCDGVVAQCGQVQDDTLIQAKGKTFRLTSLLGLPADNVWVKALAQAHYHTIYLAPKDYHRVHMPYGAKLVESLYIPGTLWPVNEDAVTHVDALFARNERLVMFFEAQGFVFSVIMVGAFIVGGIETTFLGRVCPGHGRKIKRWDHREQHLFLEQGSELGRFVLGSTVICLYGASRLDVQIQAGQTVQVGSMTGEFKLAV